MCTFLQLLQLQSPRQRGQGQACSWTTCAPAQPQHRSGTGMDSSQAPSTHRLDSLAIAVQQAPGAPVQRAFAALCLHLHRLLPALAHPRVDCQAAAADDITTSIYCKAVCHGPPGGTWCRSRYRICVRPAWGCKDRVVHTCISVHWDGRKQISTLTSMLTWMRTPGLAVRFLRSFSGATAPAPRSSVQQRACERACLRTSAAN